MNRAETIKLLKRLGWLVGLFASAAFIISAIERKDAANATGLVIDIEPVAGEHLFITQEDIRKLIDRSFGFRLDDLPVAAVDVERLERVLEEEPFVLDADAFIDAQNRIRVKVVQREPVLRVIDNNNLTYYLDEWGRKMPISPHYTARVLVASGNIPPYVPNFLERKRHKLKDLFLLANYIREDAFFQALFEQVYLNQKGDFVLIPNVGDQKIVLGTVQDMEQKLENLKVFYREAMPYEGWNKYRTINLSYNGQVVCERR